VARKAASKGKTKGGGSQPPARPKPRGRPASLPSRSEAKAGSRSTATRLATPKRLAEPKRSEGWSVGGAGAGAARRKLAELEQLQDQDRERSTTGWNTVGRELKAAIEVSDHEHARTSSLLAEMTRHNAEQFRTLTFAINTLKTRQNEIDGREARLNGAIEKALLAADVLNRVELGLRPMLARALEAEAAGSLAEPKRSKGGSEGWYTDAYDTAARAFNSSIRS
jgi:hypothetical protein